MPSEKLSYLESLRRVVGARKLITPGVRAIIRDAAGAVLLIQRRDNGRWAFPAGGLELEESVWGCLLREVREETGLEVIDAELFAIYSDPRFSVTNDLGEMQQKLTIVFIVDTWAGELLTATNETIDARFFALDELPPLAAYYMEAIEDLKDFHGKVVIK